MIDDLVRDYLHGQLRSPRQASAWKLDGLSEYDVRRPLTATGTNLLGLVKRLATLEVWHFGEVFGRPFPETLGRWQDADRSDLWMLNIMDTTAGEAHRAKIERAAQEAASASHHADLSGTSDAMGTP